MMVNKVIKVAEKILAQPRNCDVGLEDISLSSEQEDILRPGNPSTSLRVYSIIMFPINF